MCFFEKNDLLMWVNIDGYNGRLLLRLQLDGEGGEYNDFFTIEQPVGGGKGTDVLFVIPFKTIRDLYYMKSNSGGPYKLCFDVADGDPRLMNVYVEKHCFSYFDFRKMEKLYRKYKTRYDK